MLLSILKSLFVHNSDTKIITITIRDDIFYRTKLMCKCVTEQINFEFVIEDAIDAVYQNFIYMCIKNYNPDIILMLAIPSVQKDMIFDIFYDGVNSGKGYIKSHYNFTKIDVEILKNDIEKAKLIIDEIREMYHTNLTVEELISNVYTNYMMKYLIGELALYKLFTKYGKALKKKEEETQK